MELHGRELCMISLGSQPSPDIILTHLIASLVVCSVRSYALYGARSYPGGVSSRGISSRRSLPSSPIMHIFSPSSSSPPNLYDMASLTVLGVSTSQSHPIGTRAVHGTALYLAT